MKSLEEEKVQLSETQTKSSETVIELEKSMALLKAELSSSCEVVASLKDEVNAQKGIQEKLEQITKKYDAELKLKRERTVSYME